jgi:hypothetical protein
MGEVTVPNATQRVGGAGAQGRYWDFSFAEERDNGLLKIVYCGKLQQKSVL